MRTAILACLPVATIFAFASPAAAQDSLVACESQREIEQVLQSGGDLMPEGCQNLNVTRIESDAGELCVLEFENPDPGIVGQVTEAVVPTQWWVACADLPTP